MFSTALASIHATTIDYLVKNDQGRQGQQPVTPPPSWTCMTALSIWANYPLSVSRPILITEIEARWRSELRRGDHGGKLQQALRSDQLSLDTVLEGTLRRVDAHRCRLVEDGGAEADMILHKQFLDLAAFVSFSAHNADICDGRVWSFTQCRLLPFAAGGGGPTVLLPTPLGMLHMDVSRNQVDEHLYNSILRGMHDTFLEACVARDPSAPAAASANAALQVRHNGVAH